MVARSVAGGVVAAVLLLGARPGTVRADSWCVPLEVENHGAVVDTVTFGIDPAGTAGIDPQLGEVELPPWPPTSLFEVRFLIPNTEGVKLDLRDSTATQRLHTIRWQAGTGGYPITVRWDRDDLPLATLYIGDGYGGVFIPPIDMHAADSLVVPASLGFVRMLTLDVTPSTAAEADPVVGEIPDSRIFLGQRFPEYDLDEYVADPDTPDELLDWSASGQQALVVTIEDRVLFASAPPGWTGEETIHLLVRDPQARSDETDVVFAVQPGGLPMWTVPMTLRNAGEVEETVRFGVHPQATDGIDADLGEISLPPWPPSEILDARLLLPDDLTSSKLDTRESREQATVYHLEWQAGEGGYPVTVLWPEELPEGSFFLQDDLGGVFIPPLDMSTATSVVVPDSFITGLQITATPVVDVLPPTTPANLHVVGWDPWTWVELEWEPASDPHFGFYEVLYDTTNFDTDATYSWDWSEDPALLEENATHTSVGIFGPAECYAFRVRAWDRFGNASALSNLVLVSLSAGVPGGPRLIARDVEIRAWPRPSRGRTQFGLFAETAHLATLRVYDVAGRCVRAWSHLLVPAGETSVAWDGRDQSGRLAGRGVYDAVLETDGAKAHARIILVE